MTFSDFAIVDYFELPPTQQTDIIHQLESKKDLWGALPFIINCLKKEGQPKVSPTDGGFHDLLGPGRFFLLLNTQNFKIAAFVSLARNDEVDIFVHGRENWTPWISCVFTYPEYRGHRLSQKMIHHAEKIAIKEFNAEYAYISTDHIGLYEKYGYEFFTKVHTVWGDETRVLRKKLQPSTQKASQL
ncbi:MAG: GNAT family N-acetyltransferase [Treponema sp.]|nr:GNAT family N-acetyltransferase [Treponema sp.]